MRYRYHFLALGVLEQLINGTKRLGGLILIWYHFPARGTNLVKRKGTKKMLIKFEVEDAEAFLIRTYYGQKVASKAFRMAALEAPELHKETLQLRDVIDDQRIEIRRLQGIIEQARSAAALLLEKTSQGDLLNG